MCLAQEPQRNDAGEARTRGPRSRVKYSTTEPLRSLSIVHALVRSSLHRHTDVYIHADRHTDGRTDYQTNGWKIKRRAQ